MKTRDIDIPRRRPPRRHRRCRCRKNLSPLVDTFHEPVTRWVLTALAVGAGLAHLTGLFAVALLFAVWAWRHR